MRWLYQELGNYSKIWNFMSLLLTFVIYFNCNCWRGVDVKYEEIIEATSTGSSSMISKIVQMELSGEQLLHIRIRHFKHKTYGPAKSYSPALLSCCGQEMTSMV